MLAELQKIWRFGLVGLVNTGVGLTVIYGLKYFGGVGDVWANIGGYGVGLSVSFILNSTWTFENGLWSPWVVVKYLFAFGLAYGANLATVLFALHLLEINSYLAQAFGLPVYMVLFYCLCRWVVFPSLAVVTLEQSDQ